MKLIWAAVLSISSLILGASGAVFVQDEIWTKLQSEQHRDRYNNPSTWDRDRLKMDLENDKLSENRHAMFPFPKITFPTPDYADSGVPFSGVLIGPLELNDGMVGALAGVSDAYEGEIAEGKTYFDYLDVTPVMALVVDSDGDGLKSEGLEAVSRSHPHYLYQGTMSSTLGQLDWVALRLGDGREVGIVNGRIFDLGVGNVILARQKEDGSVIFFQQPKRVLKSGFNELNDLVSTVAFDSAGKSFFGDGS